MRLFLGTFLNKELLDNIPFLEIEKLFNEDLKPIKKENIHMTWVFLGEVNESKTRTLQEIMEKHKNIFEGLMFKSSSLDFWPKKKSPRLIVLSGELNKKVDFSNLLQEIKTICNPDMKEDFLPHITIARFKKDRTISKKIVLPQIKNFNWKIKEIALIQSILSSTGPVYSKHASWIFS